MDTPTIHEEEMEDYEDGLEPVGGLLEPASSSPAGAPNRTIRPATTVRNRLGRPTLVCQETGPTVITHPHPQCKRLKLKCNRRTPCDKCIEKKRECKYDPGALTKVDVQSVHNTQIRHQFLLEAITHFLGIPEEEVQMIMNAPTYPPRPDFPGPTVDVKRLRAALGIEGTASHHPLTGDPLANRAGRQHQQLAAITDLFALASAGRSALLPPAIVSFSRPPPQIPNPSANIFNGGSLATTTRRNQIPSVMVDLATRVFQGNSIVVSHHVLAQLQLWMRVLGWEPKSANEGSIPAATIKPATTPAAVPAVPNAEEEDAEENQGVEGGPSSSRAKSKKPVDNNSSNTVLVTAPPSEIEYYDVARPRDVSVLALAHEVFVQPAIAAQQHAAGGSTNPAPSHAPYSFSAPGFGASSAPGSAQPAPFPGFSNGMPSLVTSPRSSLSPPPSAALPLITPQVVLRYLPPKNWRTAFMHEFDTLMINHDGIGVSGRHSVLKKRIELMFEWADGSMKRMGSNGGESGPDSGSTFSSSSSFSSRGRRNNSIPAGRGRGRGDGKEPKPLPPPPTVALFAVASAVYALGALSYASKSIHGTFPEDEDAEDHAGGNGSAAGSSATAIPAAQGETTSMPPPSFLPGFGGATSPTTPMSSLNPSSMNFTLTGDGSNSAAAAAAGTWGLTFPNPNPNPQERQPGTATLNPHTHPLPEKDKAMPSNLLNLARAALLFHDESALPPSLDYLHAHMLTWLYLLHPSDCASSVTSCRFEGASAGVGTGGMTVVEQTIYKELGKCVSVARGMGLDLVDRQSKPRSSLGGAFAPFGGRSEESEEEDEGMGVWEKEMRRRVWWQLMVFDQQISDNLGKLPLIPPGTYACKPPSEADESVFGPTATAIPKPPETAKGYNTTYFAAKCQLLAIIKTLSFAQLEDGVTLDLARQLDGRLSNWRTALPAQYKIDFREKPEDTMFPDLDTVDVQACDLHMMANVFLLRLWLPFFNEALSSTSQSSQGVLLTATTAANAIIVASHHLVTRFKAARPMSFGHYDFGNSIWFASAILASIVTMKSDVIFSSTARRGVEIAGALFQSQVLEGKSDLVYKPKYEVNKIMAHITRLVGEVPKGKRSTGSKRKSDGVAHQMKMRYGAPLPYVGVAAITSATDINVPHAQSALLPESRFGWWRSPAHQDSDDMSSASAPPRRPRTEKGTDPGPPSDSERFLSMDEDTAPGLSAFVPEVPNSRASSVAGQSRMSTSQASSSQSNKSHGSITVRRRRLQGSSPQAPPTPSTPGTDLPSDSKRPRGRGSVPAVGEPSSSNSPYTHPYPLSSSQPDTPVMMPPPNQPSTMQPPQITEMTAPNPVFHQGRPSQNPQHRHGISPSVTIGNYNPVPDFSQPPQSAVPPGGYQNPMNPAQQQPPHSAPYSYYAQMQSRGAGTGAIIAVDSRSPMPPSHAYGSPASAVPQTALPMTHPPTDGYLTNLPATGGPPTPHQPESYNPSASASHMGSQDNIGPFEFTGMLTNQASVMHEAPQFTGHPQAHQPQHYPMGPLTQATWTNVPAPQTHGAPTHQSQSATTQGWPHSDPSGMQYMGGPHPP
ncbi:hypothetical protein FS837_004128 [Tulasnella sp. UAMH 9824]|nr:hypothetical protein FS837_004128 [Tulasnella sp. UAMH 9824]